MKSKIIGDLDLSLRVYLREIDAHWNHMESPGHLLEEGKLTYQKAVAASAKADMCHRAPTLVSRSIVWVSPWQPPPPPRL